MLTRIRRALAGRYTIERELGRGATAIVFSAHDLRHGRRVALKVVRPEIITTAGSGRFLNEIRTTAKLNHPHILPLFDSGEADGLIYYTMPLIEGSTLRERLDDVGRMSLEAVGSIVTEIAEALAYAHGRGTVHRDIKPENILIGERGHALLADFGLARALTQAVDRRLTSAGIALGSPQYMSPEQAAGESDVDGRSDTYSLACVAYEALCGAPPFTAGSVSSLLARHLAEPAPSIRDRAPDLPVHADDAIRRALSKERELRFQDPQAFAAALTSSLTTAVSAAHVPHALSVGRTRRMWRRRTPVLLALLAGAAIAVALVTWRSLRPGAAATGIKLAVFPFRTSAPGIASWAEAVPDLLSGVLDGATDLAVADPWSLWKPLRPDPSSLATSPDPERAAGLAKRSGASRFILGSIVHVGESATVTARVYDTETGSLLRTLKADGQASDPGSIVRRLAVDILGAIAVERGMPAIGRLQTGLTESPDALKAYMSARLAMRRGMVDSADVAIGNALAHDSTFTPAIVDAAIIRSWAQFMRGEQYWGLRELVDRGLARDSLLRPRERSRLHALDASIRTDGRTAAAALHEILAQDSTDLQAWSMLQYVGTTYGWQYGASEGSMVDVLERGLRLDSAYVPLLANRAWLAVAMNDGSQHDRLLRLLAIDSSSQLARGATACLRAVSVNDSAFAALASRLDRRAGLAMLRCLRHARPDRALQFAGMWRAADDPWLSARGAAEDARMQIARGRTRYIAARVGEGEFSPETASLMRLLTAGASLAGVGDSAAAAAAVAALAREIPLDSAAAFWETKPVVWVVWMVAAHNAQRGDTLLAKEWRDAMTRFPSGGSPAEYAAAMIADVDARLAYRRGDRRTALQQARRAFELWDIHTESAFEFMAEPQMRFHLALLHRSVGESDSAHALFRSLVPPTTWMGFLTARASFELGQLEEEAGRAALAERHYAAALRLWAGGDAEIGQWRRQAEQGLDRARADRGRRLD